jgi:transcriptional regulator with XRE-family HTH domain
MVDALHYYFETLPVHPHPERLESFTSYLTRLAEANGLRSLEALASTCFFDQYVRTMRWQKDNPPVSFGQLPIAANCLPSELLATTFFHLGKKFERPGLPQSLSHFLSGAIARFLRYCPQCIAETPYYRLTWRFLLLSGCVRHNNMLLNACGHCDHSIPIFTSPFKIGICPNCRGDLKLCRAACLTTGEHNTAVTYAQELEFLLSPQPWEAYTHTKRMGAYFADLRQKKHLTVAEVAGLIGTTRHGVEAVEYGNIGASSSPFERYIRYAQFLGVSMQEVFEATMLRNNRLKGPRVRNLPLSEEEMVERLEQAIQRLNDRGVLVTQRALSKESGIARNRFVSYPRVKILLKETLSNVREHQEKLRTLLRIPV